MSDRPRSILPKDAELQTGDLVLRRGGGIASRAVIYADENGTYSHIGIVVDSAGHMMVVHAVPDEPDFKGDQDRVKMEPLHEFFSSIKAVRGCAMRCHDDSLAHKAALHALDVYRRHALFDHDYDERDTTKMYCCELIAHVYSKAGLQLIHPPYHDINLPAFRFSNVIMPSDFLKSEHLTLVTAF